MPDFKTTFIPKQQNIPERKEIHAHHLNPINFIGWLFFFVIITIVAGFFGYKFFLDRSIESKIEDIRRAKEAIDPSFVNNVKQLDTRLKAAKILLDNHIALSLFFDILEDTTLTTVRFKGLEFSKSDDGLRVSLPGESKDFRSIALQSDAWEESNSIKDTTFSKLKLNQFGNVEFNLEGVIQKGLISFKNSFKESSEEGSPPQLPTGEF